MYVCMYACYILLPHLAISNRAIISLHPSAIITSLHGFFYKLWLMTVDEVVLFLRIEEEVPPSEPEYPCRIESYNIARNLRWYDCNAQERERRISRSNPAASTTRCIHSSEGVK